jgi:hypothetical protein
LARRPRSKILHGLPERSCADGAQREWMFAALLADVEVIVKDVVAHGSFLGLSG